MKITIVTVCYNAVESLEQTMLSVLTQSYKDIEYVVIDGGSKDGTVDIIKKYADSLAYWVSEPDEGIYDAMNKGIDFASGDWIIFMNSGDVLVDSGVLCRVFAKTLSWADVVIGDTIYIFPWGRVFNKGKLFSDKTLAMPFCHQSSFVRTKVMKEYKFDLSYRICADYNFFHTIYHKGVKFQKVEETVSAYEVAGISSTRLEEVYREECRVNGMDKTGIVFLKGILICKLKKIIPTKLYTLYRRHSMRNDIIV